MAVGVSSSKLDTVEFSTEDQRFSHSLDDHDIIINHLRACDPSTKIFNDPCCH